MKKVLNTTVILHGLVLEYVRSLLPLEQQHKRQFSIICGCNSMAHANRICEAYGLGSKVFTSAYTSQTGNTQEINLAINGGVFIRYDNCNYVSLDTILNAINKQIR